MPNGHPNVLERQNGRLYSWMGLSWETFLITKLRRSNLLDSNLFYRPITLDNQTSKLKRQQLNGLIVCCPSNNRWPKSQSRPSILINWPSAKISFTGRKLSKLKMYKLNQEWPSNLYGRWLRQEITLFDRQHINSDPELRALHPDPQNQSQPRKSKTTLRLSSPQPSLTTQ